MKDNNATVLVITALDEVACEFNAVVLQCADASILYRAIQYAWC